MATQICMHNLPFNQHEKITINFLTKKGFVIFVINMPILTEPLLLFYDWKVPNVNSKPIKINQYLVKISILL